MAGTGGARPGAGRKKGKKTAKTLEREAVLAEFRQRTMRSSDVLFNSQITLARGQTFLYKIEKELIVGPKGGKSYRAKRPELVTSQWEIEAYLEGKLEDHDIQDREATYYFLTTKEPNNGAIDSMLDRSLGKPTLPLSGPDGGPLQVELVEYVKGPNTI